MFFKKKEAGSDGRLLAVQTGLVVPVSEVDDPVFAQSILGGGVAIRPEGNEVLSPASGRIISVQDTGHAYGLRTDDGMEILVHIGINTMELKGRGFSSCVRTGQKIRRAEPLCRIDLPLLRQLGYQTDIMVLVTNQAELSGQLRFYSGMRAQAGQTCIIERIR